MKSKIKVLLCSLTGTGMNMCGVCGKESDLVDIDGNKLCVGDVVEYSMTTKGKRDITGKPYEFMTKGKTYVVEYKNEIFLMGIKDASLEKWNVRKIKSYTDTRQNEQYHSVITKLKKPHVIKQM